MERKELIVVLFAAFIIGLGGYLLKDVSPLGLHKRLSAIEVQVTELQERIGD